MHTNYKNIYKKQLDVLLVSQNSKSPVQNFKQHFISNYKLAEKAKAGELEEMKMGAIDEEPMDEDGEEGDDD